ncbi:hypothetical protein OH77DRAFT_1044351 [Trametes cingulata]|nr:hypothetical protein OH77DRAFT_1044351 [Trametes cingulata]
MLWTASAATTLGCSCICLSCSSGCLSGYRSLAGRSVCLVVKSAVLFWLDMYRRSTVCLYAYLPVARRCRGIPLCPRRLCRNHAARLAHSLTCFPLPMGRLQVPTSKRSAVQYRSSLPLMGTSRCISRATYPSQVHTLVRSVCRRHMCSHRIPRGSHVTSQKLDSRGPLRATAHSHSHSTVVPDSASELARRAWASAERGKRDARAPAADGVRWDRVWPCMVYTRRRRLAWSQGLW